MNEQQKQQIYKKWCDHQKKNNQPIPQYSYRAYTNETYKMWESIMRVDQ